MEDYTIQTVTVLSRGEQVAWVQTHMSGFVVGSIPQAFTDVREAGILAKAETLADAKKWYEKEYGN